ncbi:MAG: GNAT family N-acetyltransferase [Bacteroidetes bacterium]|nr:MAG: GNAT family N-acetyltransferase [Bacteroidota bacterium]
MIEFLSWDTDFFGYKVGKIINNKTDIYQIITEAKKEKYTLLYGFLNPNDIFQNEIYQKNNGFLADEKITFLQNVPNINPQNNPTEIYKRENLYENKNESEDLISLALQSGEFSRFKIDKNFEQENLKQHTFEKLYTIWIENSVNKKIAKNVIIQQENQKIVGVLTLGIKNNRADIGILAVDNDYRGKKIGQNLILKAFEESKKLAQTQIQVVTQKANQNACYFYEKMGFMIEKTENIYHFWIK